MLRKLLSVASQIQERLGVSEEGVLAIRDSIETLLETMRGEPAGEAVEALVALEKDADKLTRALIQEAERVLESSAEDEARFQAWLKNQRAPEHQERLRVLRFLDLLTHFNSGLLNKLVLSEIAEIKKEIRALLEELREPEVGTDEGENLREIAI